MCVIYRERQEIQVWWMWDDVRYESGAFKKYKKTWNKWRCGLERTWWEWKDNESENLKSTIQSLRQINRCPYKTSELPSSVVSGKGDDELLQRLGFGAFLLWNWDRRIFRLLLTWHSNFPLVRVQGILFAQSSDLRTMCQYVDWRTVMWRTIFIPSFMRKSGFALNSAVFLFLHI